ncbi:MAG: peptidoglycan-binding protein [Firmicutes bacterium]|nr:peptidoglycan-binding protein [Bacillota bacterium]
MNHPAANWVPRTLLIALVVPAVLVVLAYVSQGAPAVLRVGDRGDSVIELQEYLSLAGYLDGAADGIFGPATLSAVRRFQADAKLDVDGVVGASTWDALLSVAAAKATRTYVVRQGDTMYDIALRFGVTVEAIAAASGISRPELIRPGQELVIPADPGSRSRSARGDVELVHWSRAREIFTYRATIIDVETGLSFRVQRRGGYNHADAEPLTAEDTAVMKRIYGGSWSWNRRAVVVVAGGHRMAASINGFPHGGGEITNNNFNGHFCVHFLGSRTHASNSLDPDHQRQVRVAAGY